MNDDRAEIARQWLEAYIVAKVGIPSASFSSVASAPLYEVLDSLDLVELLGAFEETFMVTLDPSSFDWGVQLSLGELAADLATRA